MGAFPRMLFAAVALAITALCVVASPWSHPLVHARSARAGTSAGPMVLLRHTPRPRAHARLAHRRPVVLVQPRSMTVAAGRVAGFTAAASGVPAPRPQWQRSLNGGRTWANIPRAHGVTYTFTARRSQTGTEYRAVFANLVGRTMTKAVRLTVRTPRTTGSGSGSGAAGSGAGAGSGSWPGPEPFTGPAPSGGSGPTGGSGGSPSGDLSPPQITTEPADDNVQSGQTASFVTGASGTVDSVQWEVSTDGGAQWASVPSATAMSYSFLAATSENGYEYRAVLSNSAGSATTRPALLTVTAPGPPTAPQVTTQPGNKTVGSGNSGTFTAAASGNPTPTVQWEVSSNAGQTWSPILNATSTSYSVTPTMAQSGYEYRATFTNVAGTVITNAATLTVAAQSQNWAGYVAFNQVFRTVTGSWNVPSVSCPANATSYSSQWIGIDGAQSSTVEQDGTESDCFNGAPNYDAWYEMYGDSAVNSGYEVELPPATYPVNPGDAMTASVSLSGSTWTLAINDTTAGWQYSINIASPSPAPQQSSAEWILERPGVGGSLAVLSDFGNAAFTNATATGNSASGPISDFTNEAAEMTGSTVLATPGPLGPTGDAFGVTWNAGS